MTVDPGWLTSSVTFSPSRSRTALRKVKLSEKVCWPDAGTASIRTMNAAARRPNLLNTLASPSRLVGAAIARQTCFRHERNPLAPPPVDPFPVPRADARRLHGRRRGAAAQRRQDRRTVHPDESGWAPDDRP